MLEHEGFGENRAHTLMFGELYDGGNEMKNEEDNSPTVVAPTGFEPVFE